jgi:uncharacterized protein YcnI
VRQSLVVALSAIACLTSYSASAHITLETREAPADSYFKAVFSVPHGCAGSPTTKVRVRIPDGVTGVKPQPKPGWELSTVKTKVEGTVQGDHGAAVTQAITEVIWIGKLPDEYFDQFVMQLRLPDVPAGTVLYFPVVQECEKGVTRWIERPEAGKTDLREPAPALRLTPKSN